MAKTHKGYMSASIETRVELEPGSLSVSAYDDLDVTGSDVLALDRAIAEAQRYIAQVRRIRAHVKKHGIGVEPKHHGSPSPHLGQDVADAWAKVLTEKQERSIFDSREIFKALR